MIAPRVTACIFVVLTLFCGALQHAQAREPFTLENVRAQVRRDYASVPQLSTEALAERLRQGTDLLLLDVREPREFAVSRIAGAERVDPGVWRWSFMNRFNEQVRGKTVVFYCAVGVRSSALAARVQAALKERGAEAVYNLDGGVFAWHNEGRPLVNAKGATDFVHPFDSYWGRLVRRRALLSTMPK